MAVQLLRGGGTLGYSTCRGGGGGGREGTVDPVGNEEKVAVILRGFPLRLVPGEAGGGFGKAGLENCGLNREQCE